jgi:hypothetical protein
VRHVVDQEVALLREAGHRVDRFERRSDDIAAMSLPRKALVPLGVPWNPRPPAGSLSRSPAASQSGSIVILTICW